MVSTGWGPERLVEALIPHVGRIRSLQISLPQYACEVLGDFPDADCCDGWPLLENLYLTTWGPSAQPLPTIDPPDPSHVFSRAPKLREVTLNAIGGQGSRFLRNLGLALPWAQITNLTTSDVFRTAQLTRQVVLQCPLLEHCSLGTVRLWHQNATVFDLPASTFPHLQTLSINLQHQTEEAFDGAARFFQPFVMPALQELDIRAKGAPEASETHAYINFIYSHCGATLTHLSIGTIPFEIGGAVELLKLLPALVSFSASFTHAASEEGFFRALRYDADANSTETSEPPLVPHLERLSISEYPLVDTEIGYILLEPVISAITSRWWSDTELATLTANQNPAVARLKYVRLSWNDDNETIKMSKEQRAKIEKYKQEGLNVWIDGMPVEGTGFLHQDLELPEINLEAMNARFNGGNE